MCNSCNTGMKLHDLSDRHATTHCFSLRCHPVFSAASRSASRFNVVFGSSLQTRVKAIGPVGTKAINSLLNYLKMPHAKVAKVAKSL